MRWTVGSGGTGGRVSAAVIAIVLLGVALPGAFSAEVKPPAPDPANPVNYIKWLNDTLGGGVKQNAADVYQQAFEKAVHFDGKLDTVLAGPWSENKKVSDWLAGNKEALALFRKAAKMRDCFLAIREPEPTGDRRRDHMISSASLPSLGQYRELVKALVAEGYRAWGQGDQRLLPADAMLVLRSARHLQRTPILIQYLVGMSSENLAYESLRNAIALSDKPDEAAARILADLEWSDARRPPFSRILVGERVAGLDNAQRPQTGFEVTVQDVNAFYDELEAWLAKPYHLASKEDERLDAKLRQSKNPLLKTVLPSLESARGTDERIQASRRATHLIAYVLIQHGEDKQYPASLAELKAPSVKDLRTDPFSGRDFVYKRQGDGFVLYSVGVNLTDDGGKHDSSWSKGDFVFWPVQKFNK